MDPGARRAMWGAILSATAPPASPQHATDEEAGGGGQQEEGYAVLLTTHSMEEVEVRGIVLC